MCRIREKQIQKVGTELLKRMISDTKNRDNYSVCLNQLVIAVPQDRLELVELLKQITYELRQEQTKNQSLAIHETNQLKEELLNLMNQILLKWRLENADLIKEISNLLQDLLFKNEYKQLRKKSGVCMGSLCKWMSAESSTGICQTIIQEANI